MSFKMTAKYVHELSSRVTLDLSSVLNDNDDWKTVASEYGFTNIEISNFRTVGMKPGCSPAESMLKGLGMRNCRVDQLFHLLFQLRFMHAMHVLKPHVPTKYELN